LLAKLTLLAQKQIKRVKTMATLIKRKNGIYYIAYFDENGRRRWVSTRTSDKNKAMEFLKLFQSGKSQMYLSDFVEKFMEYANSVYRTATRLLFAGIFKKFMEIVGDKPLFQIGVEDVERYKVERLKSVSVSKVSIDLRALRSAFNKAVKWGYVSKNVFAEVDIPKSEVRSKAFTDEDLKKLLEAIKEQWLKEIVLFALGTGMRLGEIVNLTWDCVDLERGIAKVILPPFICEMLKKKERKGAYVFTFGGRPISKNYITHRFKDYVRFAGLDEAYHFHCLRHTYATKLIEASASLFVVKEALGHKSVGATQIYSHLEVERCRPLLESAFLELQGLFQV
jgi:site-specific recombinase XerD